MTTSKHTPGPWHRNIAPATRYPVIFAGRNTHIASVLFGARHGQTLPDAEIEANCNIIAAAPEMLTVLTYGPSVALSEFLEWVADRLVQVHCEPPGADFVISLRERARLARTAIAKAQGAAHG